MIDFEALLDRLEQLLGDVERLDEDDRATVFELLDGVDTLHRHAVSRLAEVLGSETVARAAEAHPAIGWLFEAYGLGGDERAAAEAALEPIRPYIDSHGGSVEVLDVADGVVRLRMAGSCAGCTASAVTLKAGIEEALRDGLPGFAGVEVEQDDAPAHPPPGPTLATSPPPGATVLQVHHDPG